LRRAAHCEIAGRTAGFTILEVLIAIAVVAVVLGAIGAVTSTTTRGVRSLEQHVVLMETARSVAASLRSRETVTPAGLSGELFGNRWRIGIAPLTEGSVALSPASPWIPQIVSIRVQSPSGAVVAVDTVRLQRRRE
jgi:general secretion pathway protein I